MASSNLGLPNIFYNSFVLYGISSTIISPLIPIISSDLKVGYNKIGLVFLIGSIFSILLTFISGRLCDKFNIKIITIVGIFLIFLGFLLFGTHLNFIIFTLIFILIQSGYGIINPVAHTYAARIFYKSHSPTFLKIDLYWYFGAIAGPLLISLMLFFKISFKFLFLAISLSFLLLLLAFFRVNFKSNSEKVKSEEKDSKIKAKFFTIINPILIITSLMLFFYIGSLNGLTTWMTTYLTAYGLNVSIGSLVLSFYWLFSIAGLFFIRKLLRKINEITILLSGVILGIIFTFVFSFINLIYVKVICLLLQAIFFSVIFPLALSITVHESNVSSGTLIGFNMAAAMSGSILFQPLLGFIAEYVGKDSIVYLILAGLIIGLIFNLVLYILIRKKNKAMYLIKETYT